MHPLSQYDRSAVELTMRLLRTSAREAMAAGDMPTAQLRHVAAVECAALLAERTPKAPPEPGAPTPGPHP